MHPRSYVPWTHRTISVISNKYDSYQLITLIVLCCFPEKRYSKTSRLVYGDRNAHRVLRCLSDIAELYGEQVVLLQYIPCCVDMVRPSLLLSAHNQIHLTISEDFWVILGDPGQEEADPERGGGADQCPSSDEARPAPDLRQKSDGHSAGTWYPSSVLSMDIFKM